MTDIAGMNPIEVLKYLSKYVEIYGWPPSRREIAKEFGVSPSSVQLMLKEMVDDGLVKVPEGSHARQIAITQKGLGVLS